MKKKKRKLNVKNLLKVLIVPVLVVGILVFFSGDEGNKIEQSPIVNNKFESFLESKNIGDFIFSPSEILHLDMNKLRDSNYISYKNIETLDIELYSRAYLLVDLENRDALYGYNYDEKIYPASLTKLLTLDAVLSLYHEQLDKTSSFTEYERAELIAENASLAYLNSNTEYTVKDLLYGLMLPSGADAAKGLENLMAKDNIDLIGYMNIQAKKLGLANSNFINASGLHDDEHYTTLDDLFKVIWDILKYSEGKKILSTMEYYTEDEIKLNSTLKVLGNISEVKVLGGKTGFTGEAGENIFVYYEYNGASYVLLLANADGNPYKGETYHFDDVNSIIKKLYNSDVE